MRGKIWTYQALKSRTEPTLKITHNIVNGVEHYPTYLISFHSIVRKTRVDYRAVSNKNDRLHQQYSYDIFLGLVLSHLVLGLMKKECNKPFDYIIIIWPALTLE